MRLRYWIRSLIIVVSICMTSAAAAAQQQYVIADLGKLGGSASQSVGISDDGYVGGWSETNQTALSGGALKRPFFWRRGIMTELPGLAAGRNTTAVSYAKAPGGNFLFPLYYMTGDAETSNGTKHAYVYSSALFFGGIRDIGTLPNTTESFGRGVNAQGQVAGWSRTAAGATKAFFYNGSLIDISFGSAQSASYSVNNAGQVVGHMYTGVVYHAFLYDSSNGQRQDLGAPNGYTHSYSFGINQSGQVVGYASTAPFTTGSYRGYVYTNGVFQIIGTSDNVARAINNSGQVVGSYKSILNGNDDRAYIWENGAMTDLNTLIPSTSGWVVKIASAINNDGQIVGYGTIGGETHAFLMTPLPMVYNVVEIPVKKSQFVPGNSLRINNSGRVVGESANGYAAYWDMAGGLRELTNVPSHAYNINDLGEIVGDSAGRAFYYAGAGQLRDLGTLGGLSSVALGINISFSPKIVGKSPAAVDDRAFYLGYPGIMTNLGVPSGSLNKSAASSVNDFDQVVGAATGVIGFSPFGLAFVWTPTDGMLSLPALGGFGSFAEAWEINNAGQAVGWAHRTVPVSGQVEHACVWKKDASGVWQVTDIGSPGGLIIGRNKASSINNLAQIVGYSNITQNGTILAGNRAFIWQNGQMINLNDKIGSGSGIVLLTALDINDAGQIVCLGTANGQERVYLLTR